MQGTPVGRASFCWRGIYFIAMIAFTIRVAFALLSDNIYHPDELFQYLEQAHRAVFGYGWIPWEFRFGVRSWAVPGLIASLLFLCKIFGFEKPDIYIPAVKIGLCLLSTSLVFSCYFVARAIASEGAARLAALFACFWYELVYFAHKPLTSVIATYSLIGAMACILSDGAHRQKPIIAGFLLAFCIVIRFQTIPVICFIVLYLLLTWDREAIVRFGIAFCTIFIFSGTLDYCTWGRFFASYYNNYLFNVVYAISKSFGTHPIYYYPAALICSSAGILGLTGIVSVGRLRVLWFPFTCACIILLSYSVIPHKEYRFVFPVIPLLLMMLAILLAEVKSKYRVLCYRNLSLALLVIAFIFISALGALHKLPLEGKVYHFPPYLRDDNLTAYRFLSKQSDLGGILELSRWWYGHAGYYYLHRNVPIYFPYHFRSPNKSHTSEAHSFGKLRQYVSHILCPSSLKSIRGFRPTAQFGTLEIREQIDPPHKYRQIDSYSRIKPQVGIDGEYVPTVRPLL